MKLLPATALTVWLLVSASALLAAALAPTPSSTNAPYAQSGPPVSGMPAPEDLISIPGTSWLIVGSMRSRDASGHLYLIDAASAVPVPTVLYPTLLPADLDAARFADCPGQLDDSRFTPHGINLSRLSDGSFELLAVNHGGRESVEVFQIKMDAPVPRASWRGCVVLPANASGNGVAALPGGGFVVTNFLDKSDPNYLQKMGAGDITGDILKWVPGAGWSEAVQQKFSGANGVAISRDGRWLFVSEWSAYRVWRFALHDAAKPKSIHLDFLPDNLRLTDSGSVLIAGQNADPVDVMTCKSRRTPCPSGFTVVEMDPLTMSVRPLAHGGDATFGGATGAAIAGGTLWVGAYYGSEIARFTFPKR
jgi:hypothetical protein